MNIPQFIQQSQSNYVRAPTELYKSTSRPVRRVQNLSATPFASISSPSKEQTEPNTIKTIRPYPQGSESTTTSQHILPFSQFSLSLHN